MKWPDYTVELAGRAIFVGRRNRRAPPCVRTENESDEGRLPSSFGFKDRSAKTVARVSKPVMVGMSAHPNGRRLLYSQVDRKETDLILVERVR